MPSDPSIYGLIQQPKPMAGPLDQYAQVMQVRHLMGQNELSDLQRGELQRGIDEGQRIRALFQRGNVTPDEISAINPAQGQAYRKSVLENQKTEGELARTRAETILKQAQFLRDDLAGVNDQAGYDAWLEKGARLFGPDAVRKNPAQFSPQVKQALLLKADDVIVPLAKQLELAGAAEGRDLTRRGQDMTSETARLGREETKRHNLIAESQARLGPPTEVTGPDGKPMLIVQDQKSGRILDANTLRPLSGDVGPKVGEVAQKQLTGVSTLKDAIGEYRNTLKNWNAADIANPNARAKMGTVYNNMMLQAKEAYNLGVLNGPDYMILQQVITNPASLMGGITSNKALDEQAQKLDEIMGRVAEKVTNTQSGLTAIDKTKVEGAGWAYEPDKYEYRVGPNGQVQRKKK